MNKKYLAISIGVGLVIIGIGFWCRPKSEMVGASVFQVQQGGTGLSSYRKGDLIYGSATNALSPLASGSTGQVLKIAGGIPSWGTDNTGGSSFTGLLMGEGSTAKTHIDSLTYSPSSFNFSPTASSGILTLDYTNGPASRSIAQTISGDWDFTNTGSHTMAGEWIFNTNTLVVDSGTGNVGIGTTSPGAKLHIYPNANTTKGLIVQADNNNSSNIQEWQSANGTVLDYITPTGELFVAGRLTLPDNTLIDFSGGNGYSLFRGGVDNETAIIAFQIKDENANKLILITTTGDSGPGIVSFAGNVGIGATGPEQKLEVGGNILASASGNVDLILNNTAASYGKFTIRSVATPSAGRLDILGGAAGTTNLVSIASNGNVGIGTTSPGAKLEVGLGSSGGYQYITNSGANEWGLTLHAGTTDVAKFTANGGTGEVRIGGNTTNYFPTFYSNGSEAMRITTTGNVGIGTTVPGGLLDVRGRFSMFGSTQGYIYFDENEINSGYNTNAEFTSYINWDGYQTGTSQFRNLNIANGKEVSIMYFQGSTGNVGIGTTTPTTKLDVIGSASVSLNFEVGGNASASATFGSGLTDCDTAATSKLLWDTTTGKFSCGTDSGAGSYLALTGGTLTGDLFGTNASLSGVFEMGTGFRVSGSVANGLTSLTSTANFFTTASVSSKLEVGTGDQFTVLAASGNTTIAGTLGVTGLASFVNASVSGNFELVAGSQFSGAGLADCDTSTKVLRWDTTTRLFSCGTLADADIPDTLTLSTITGPTSVSAAFEATTTSHLVGNVKVDGTVTFNGNVDGGASISFEIPNAATINVNVAGEVAIDEGGFGQFVYYASSSTHTLTDEKKVTVSIGSTSFNTWASRSLGYLYRGITIKRMTCQTTSATSVILRLSQAGTADTDSLTCGTTRVYDDGSIANATLTKGNNLILERSTITGEVDFVDFTYTFVEVRE